MESLITAFTEARTSYQILAVGALVALASYFLRPSPPKHGATEYPSFPRWAIIEIAIVGSLLSQPGRGKEIFSRIRRFGGSLWGVTRSHQIVHDLPNTDRFLSQSHSILDGLPRDWTISQRVFGVPNKVILRNWLEENLQALHKLTESLFINDNASTAAIDRGDVPGKAQRLVTFSEERDKQARWEHSADVKVVAPGVAEANFHALVRDFGACISIPQLYGQDFLDRNPTLLTDFWKFDNDLFGLMVIGVPDWAPLKIVKDGVAARQRLINALAAMYTRAYKHLNGEPVEDGFDMSDMSNITRGRTKLFQDHNITTYDAGAVELGNFWAQNANTQPLVFWSLLYIYSTPGLLNAIREEVAPYIVLSDSTPKSLVSADIASICRKCPLLRGTMLECFRMYNAPTSIRYVAQDLTIQDGQQQHHMKRGSWVSVAHSLINYDPAHFTNPNDFDPERFIETDADGNKAPRYGKLRPWGTGTGQCKGRMFAEKEILVIGAAVTSLWDIEPVGGGKWEIPKAIPGTGVNRPLSDIRVTLKRRV